MHRSAILKFLLVPRYEVACAKQAQILVVLTSVQKAGLLKDDLCAARMMSFCK